MMATLKRAALLWSGGKNSGLALHMARDLDWTIPCLATLVGEGVHDDEAHPMAGILLQAEALAIPLHLLPLVEPAVGESFLASVKDLRDRYELSGLIVGDVCTGVGLPSEWLERASTELDLELIRPLWGANRFQLLSEMIEREMDVRLTRIRHPEIPSEWLGRSLDVRLIADLARFAIDLSGENGEYSTLLTV